MALHDRFADFVRRQIGDVSNQATIMRTCQVVPLVVYAAIIYFFAELEKTNCSCAENASKTFIKRSVYGLMLISLLVIVLGPLRILQCVYGWLGPISTAAIRMLMLGFVVYLMIRMYNYVQHLRRIECSCATARLLDETLQYYSVAVLFTIFIALMTTLFFNLIRIHEMHAVAFAAR